MWAATSCSGSRAGNPEHRQIGGIISHMASVPVSPLSEEEYLRLERSAETKSEFFDGQMFAMAGGSFNHAQLGAQIAVVLAPRIPAGLSHIQFGHADQDSGSGALYVR